MEKTVVHYIDFCGKLAWSESDRVVKDTLTCNFDSQMTKALAKFKG